jgi:hypothetical protein
MYYIYRLTKRKDNKMEIWSINQLESEEDIELSIEEFCKKYDCGEECYHAVQKDFQEM